jgi:phage terminase Nu1 subunit (DNA packaging protein)
MPSERAQRAIERLHEDERLRGDLSDLAARALLEWAAQHVARIADDTSRSDADVASGVQAIRSAARAAARSGLAAAQEVVAAAEQALRLGSSSAAIVNRPHGSQESA